MLGFELGSGLEKRLDYLRDKRESKDGWQDGGVEMGPLFPADGAVLGSFGCEWVEVQGGESSSDTEGPCDTALRCCSVGNCLSRRLR